MPKQGSRPASWQQLPQHAPTEKKQRFAGAFTGGIPCVLDTFVGLPAALVEPAASAHLRVVEPARTSARDITLALSTRLCCVTRAAPLHVDRSLLLTCKLCSRDTNGHTVYVYMSMGFCSRDCRYGYYLGEVDKRKKRLAVAMMGQRKMSSAVTRTAKSGKQAGEVSCRPTFFTCAETE
ncbi:hypothetical protein PAHAL_5G300400 [Panicum hallii]|uniref:FLZ-type domain-containing protein n=1 Tax=Panicum hallii TaxID=206008 RepID=A0A2S3HVJ5_9POAL|nr:hypothetical protein PAHAL_5G300400 [Panicum hallii]PVH38607.1 hypothetical protein PAHAL_5G300400 [Panicum hallii]